MRHDRPWSYWAGFIVCVVLGLTVGAGFSVVTAVLYVLGGARELTAAGVTLGEAVALYLGGFGAAGMIAGAMNPIARHRMGAVVLGAVAMSPVTLGSVFLVTGSVIPPNRGYAAGVVIVAVAVGGGIGHALWEALVDITRKGV